MRSLMWVVGMVMAVQAGPVPAFAQAPAAPAKIAAGTSWINEDGSVLAITSVGANGLITGTFTTASGCGARQPHPVTGWYFPVSAGGRWRSL